MSTSADVRLVRSSTFTLYDYIYTIVVVMSQQHGGPKNCLNYQRWLHRSRCWAIWCLTGNQLLLLH